MESEKWKIENEKHNRHLERSREISLTLFLCDLAMADFQLATVDLRLLRAANVLSSECRSRQAFDVNTSYAVVKEVKEVKEVISPAGLVVK